MKQKKHVSKTLAQVAICSLAVFSLQVSAAVSVKQANRLNNDLTPFGAERAGNGKDIPAWRGGLSLPPVGYKKFGQHHIDPFTKDKPLFTITAKNMAKYDKYLSEGQKALLKTYPNSYSMPIYKTRRTAAAPEWVYEGIYKNALKAELDNSGNSLSYAYNGIAFPIPKNGIEVIWNHTTRWRGEYLMRRASEVAVESDGDYSLTTVQQETEFNLYGKDKKPEDLQNILFYYISLTKAPARLAGGAVLVHETLNQADEPRKAWGYNAGQRRVRPAPNLAYDTPVAASDGLRFVDETDIFSGAPDRYNWKLLGKREVFIPYNNYKINSPSVKYKELLQPGHINPKHTRFEKHRVWVVEGKLKKGARHAYKKRVFYIDEDTWSVTLTDQYDENNQLWRTSAAYLKTYYEVPVTWTALDVFHDLKSKRYHVQGLTNEERIATNFGLEPPGERYFTPSELRRRGRR